jgi:aryl-alcohol dehydrogenase-like predicted oxidoreductase
MRVSEISLGTWAFGGDWGEVRDEDSYATLNRAVDLGVNFFDTADVYGDGRSERLLGRLLRERDEEIFVATKAGRRLQPHTADGYTYDNLSRFVGRSLENLRLESLDLLQLHCPPTPVYQQDETFEALDRLVEEGRVKNYGVSVEKVEEAKMALEYPGVKTVQIIFNIFRQKPAEEFFPLAAERNVGILARVPLASGLLSGKMSADRRFAPNDHRNFNREGQAFDRGETFAGVDFETGLDAAEKLKELVPEGYTLAQLALRWILMHPEVSCAIPGAKRPDQLEENLDAAQMPPLSGETMARIREIYDRGIRPQVHHLW